MRLWNKKKSITASFVFTVGIFVLAPLPIISDTENDMPLFKELPFPKDMPPQKDPPSLRDMPPRKEPPFLRDMPFPNDTPEQREIPFSKDRPLPKEMPERRFFNKQPGPSDLGKRPAAPARNHQPHRQLKEHKANGALGGEEDILRVVPQTCKPATGKFIWNFEDELMINILKQASDLKCRTIVASDYINANLKLTIIGKSMMTADDAWSVLQAALASKGLALIEQGKTWTVIKRADAKGYTSPFYRKGSEAKDNEGIGTLFYRTKHANIDSLKNAARLLISKEGIVEALADQFIIVIDSNSNIRRLDTVLAEIDVEDANNKVHIIPLIHADAKTVANQLKELFDIAGPGPRGRRRGGPPDGSNKSALNIDKILADDRTNNLIIVADKESIKEAQNVINLIDQPVSDLSSKGKIHVKKLRFADAKQVAETLNNVVSQGRSRGGRFGRKPEGETSAIFEGEVKVTAHEDTNTLVTVASSADYSSLLATINKLDERKKQVYVEVAILDISLNDSNDFGIGAFAGLKADIPGLGGSSLGIIGNPGGQAIASGISTALSKDALGGAASESLGKHGIGALAVLGNFLSGGVVGIAGPSIEGTQIPSFGAVLTALTKNSSVDVLSTPYLLTTDNKEATMSVGEKIPVIRGASSVGGGGIGSALGVPMQNISYENVKITLKMTPHVGDGNNIRMDIEQDADEIGNKHVIFNQEQYSIRTKSVKSTIVLADQQTGVIGGLISHRSSVADEKVPFLGDIPILGWLFKKRASANDRKSLLLVMTPYVIESDADYKKILERKLKEREEFAKLYFGGKIRNYDPHVDYDKKTGPLASMINILDSEMQKGENEGEGKAGEIIIKPELNAPLEENKKADEEFFKEDEMAEPKIPENEPKNELKTPTTEPKIEQKIPEPKGEKPEIPDDQAVEYFENDSLDEKLALPDVLADEGIENNADSKIEVVE